MLGHTCRFSEIIRDAVIDGFKTSRCGISKPGYLNRSGLARENEQTMVCSMARQIDKNINFVFFNQVDDLFIGRRFDHMPMIEFLFEAECYCILRYIIGV